MNKIIWWIKNVSLFDVTHNNEESGVAFFIAPAPGFKAMIGVYATEDCIEFHLFFIRIRID